MRQVKYTRRGEQRGKNTGAGEEKRIEKQMAGRKNRRGRA